MQIACDTCGITIDWQPTVVGTNAYCCTGCAEGGPCTCDYAQLPRRDRPAAIAIADHRSQLPVAQRTSHND